MQTAPPKDPSDVLDYSRTWTGLLATGEAVASSAWSISGSDNALTLGSGGRAATFDDTTTTCWLLGGTVDVIYVVTNHIVTDATPAREFERSFSIAITDL